jgi:hypothetical protein
MAMSRRLPYWEMHELQGDAYLYHSRRLVLHPTFRASILTDVAVHTLGVHPWLMPWHVVIKPVGTSAVSLTEKISLEASQNRSAVFFVKSHRASRASIDVTLFKTLRTGVYLFPFSDYRLSCENTIPKFDVGAWPTRRRPRRTPNGP